MQLLADNWQLKTESLESKQELFDFAKDCGVPTGDLLLGYRDDIDPFISWFGASIGLGSLPKRHEYRITEIVTEYEFRQACLAYQAVRVAAPPTHALVAA